jgi:PAS domain S-box-containing protein
MLRTQPDGGVLLQTEARENTKPQETIDLPAPDTTGGKTLKQALQERRTSREFSNKPLPAGIISNLLWAAFGVNRATGGLSTENLLHELHVHQIQLEMQNETLRQAHNALEESRDRYVDLYDFAPIGYITLNANGIIETLNLTAATLLGAVRKDLLQRPFLSQLLADSHDRWPGLLILMLKQDGKHSVKEYMQRRDGTVFPALLDCVVLRPSKY